jgi:hypothetical protein
MADIVSALQPLLPGFAANVVELGSQAGYVQFTLTASIPGVPLASRGFSITVDELGDVYEGPVGVMGPSTPLSASFVVGSLMTPTSPQNMDAWLSGFSVGYSAGFGIGAGAQWSIGNNGGQYAIETGYYTPQAGVSLGYNFCVAGPCLNRP